MGSRYGGLKQLDGLGPNGETIMDYSIYDAIQAGFGKIVWVIRKDFEEQFRTQILAKYQGKVQCELCFQALDALPEGFQVPEGRVKPWGTNHAVLMGKDIIREPFCVINCDDFYNRDAFMVMGRFLSELPEGAKNQYAMVGFRVGNTLSENGTVARGICSTDAQGNQISFGSSWESVQVPGRYGIPAMQESDELQSILICTSGDKTFLPTRCGFTWDSQSPTAQTLEIKHITDAAGQETCIRDLKAQNAVVDIYNAQGAQVKANTNINKALQTLPRGI